MSDSEDIERNRRSTRRSFLSLNTGLIVLWSLSAVILLGFLFFKGKQLMWPSTQSVAATSAQTQNGNGNLSTSISDSPTPALMIFRVDSKVLALDPLKPELEGRLLFEDETTSIYNLHQLSEDRKRVYIRGEIHEEYSLIRCFDIETSSFSETTIPCLRNSCLVLKNSVRNSVLCAAENEDGEADYSIQLYSLEDSTVIQNYRHKCSRIHSPSPIQQLSDGSKILYRCHGDKKIYMKKLDHPDEEDTHVFSLSAIYEKIFISPDDSKAIIYSVLNRNYWIIRSLSNPEEEDKRVYFDTVISSIKSFLFSEDQRTLYIVRRKADAVYELLTIDFERLLSTDYSNLQSPYVLEPGRQISIPETETGAQ